MSALDQLRAIMRTRSGGSAVAPPPPAPRPPAHVALAPTPSPRAPERPPTAPAGFLFDVTRAPPRPSPRATWAAPAHEGDRPAALKRAVQMLFGDAPPSPQRAAAAGWTKTGGVGKVGARWEHTSGWLLEHCGHPTANYPWALYSPAGDIVWTGAVFAEPPDPGVGTAWPNLAMPMAYVTRLAPRALAEPPPTPPAGLPSELGRDSRPAAPEGFLFDITKEKGAARCRLCGMKFKAGRCWICDKGEIPRIGSARHHAWTGGLMRTMRARLEAVGLGGLAHHVMRAIMLEDVPMPTAAAPLLGDIMALPISARRYRALETRALRETFAYNRLRAEGVPHDEAQETAGEVADELGRRDELARRDNAPPGSPTFQGGTDS